VCQWLGTSDAAWIKMGAGGIGNVGGFVPYDVDPNYTGAERTGTIHVGHLTITVRQAARVAGDVNGDGYPDLFWHHRTTGQIAAWLMRGLSLLDGRLLDPPQVPDTAWSVAGVGDYARTDETDAAPDIVWEHDDGRVALWQMNGTAMTSGDPVGASQPDP